jgi:hypothetical protein
MVDMLGVIALEINDGRHKLGRRPVVRAHKLTG